MLALAPLAGAFVMAAVLSVLLSACWIGFAQTRRIQDMPGQRRLHTTATPRGGGIGIALVMVSACLLLARFDSNIHWLRMAAAIASFSAIGLYDDLRPLPAPFKLIIQLSAAALLVNALGWATALPWLLVAIIAVAYVVNVWNFMDGSNGMVATQSLLIALTISAWPNVAMPLRLAALALAGASLGFLPLNFPNARVFLGDVGSHALGASVFALLWLSWRAGTVQYWQALLFCSAMLLDASLTLCIRLWQRRKFWKAHREHLYQFAIRSGYSHTQICLVYAAWTTIAIVVARLGNAWRPPMYASMLLLAVVIIGSVVYLRMKQQWLGSSKRRRRH